MIYTITCINSNALVKRTFGYYTDLEIAKKAVSENRCNIEERYYRYCVIESYSPGIHSDSNEIQWYVFNLSEDKWKETNRPWFLNKARNFAEIG